VVIILIDVYVLNLSGWPQCLAGAVISLQTTEKIRPLEQRFSYQLDKLLRTASSSSLVGELHHVTTGVWP
jgi:hypothetical protein